MGKVGSFMSKTWTATSPPRKGEPVGVVDQEVILSLCILWCTLFDETDSLYCSYYTMYTVLSKRWFFLSVHFDTNLFHKTDSFLLLLSLSHHVHCWTIGQSFCLQNDYFTKQINFCCHFAFYTGEQKGIFAIDLCCTTSENWPTV